MELTHSFDVDRARRDTPGVAHVAHLNNAGAALPPTPVTDAVIAHLRRESEIGGYEAAALAAAKVENTYTAISRLIGCHPHEIAVIENATRAWDMAFYGLTLRAGDRILTSRAEYASNVIAFLQVAARTGAVVEIIDDDASGQLSLDDLRHRLHSGQAPVRLVAITHVPTQGGLVNPAEQVGALTREAGVPYLLDACQSVGQLPIDVEQIGCDMLSATGRKYLRGPRGTGFLYVRDSFLDQIDPPFLDLHAATWTAPDRYQIRPDARRFENWETNYAAKIGLGRRGRLRARMGPPRRSRPASPPSPSSCARGSPAWTASRCTTKVNAAAASSPSPSTECRRRPSTRLWRATASTSACRSSTTPASTCPLAVCPTSSVHRSTTTTPTRSSTDSSAPFRPRPDTGLNDFLGHVARQRRQAAVYGLSRGSHGAASTLEPLERQEGASSKLPTLGLESGGGSLLEGSRDGGGKVAVLLLRFSRRPGGKSWAMRSRSAAGRQG